MFAAVAGDFSPLTVDTSSGDARVAPPAMLIALAVGLGSMDMPIPQVASWEWVNWKFPRAVRAGETIYARWTLTQKRPPVHGDRTGIAVWRVDVHTAADGAMCAEGEIGAAITRRAGAVVASERAEVVAGVRSRRRRGRRGGGSAEPPAKPALPSPPQPAPAAERAPRRRRRKRSGSTSGNGNGDADHSGAKPPEAPPVTPEPAPAALTPAVPPRDGGPADGPLTRVMRRLRRT